MIPRELNRLLALGWHVLPCSSTSKAACFKGAVDAASCDPRQVAEWLRQYPRANWRVALGKSGIVAIDIDRPGPTHAADGFASMAALVKKYGPLPLRPTGRSGGSGGLAMIFAHQGELLIGQSGAIGPGIDPLRGRQSLMVEPSWHPFTKGRYRWLIWPDDVLPPPIPAWLAHLLKPAPEPEWHKHAWTPTTERARNAIMRAVHSVQDAPSGAANVTLNKQAFKLGMWCGAGLLAERDAEAELLAAAQVRAIPVREARDTIKSGLRAGLRQPVQARHAG